MASKCKKKYGTSFNTSYSEDFPSISSSRKGNSFAFCNVCCVDFSIFHRGKGDIEAHINREKHQSLMKMVDKNQKIDFSRKSDDDSVIRAECLFAAFLIEHNIPISAADHAGPLFRKMFPDSQIAKKYGSARTKTSAIIDEMAQSSKMAIAKWAKKHPFAISTDGSNKSEKKLYPIVLTCPVPGKQIETSLISVPVLEGDGTGENIASLLLKALKDKEIPLENCLSLGVDNARVMTGKKAGVAGNLLKEIPNLHVQGCTCHLINLAAEKSAACLPVSVEDYVIDIYYYLEKSAKRLEKFKKLQVLFDVETRKILKHVSTRWLSLGRCLKRIIENWEPLASFFKDEVNNAGRSSKLSFFKIPKIIATSTVSKSTTLKVKGAESETPEQKSLKFAETTNKSKAGSSAKIFVTPPNIISASAKSSALKTKATESELPKPKKVKMSNVTVSAGGTAEDKYVLSREEHIFMFLSSSINKAFVHFLLNTIPVFDEINVALQANSPKIHILRQMLLNMYKRILSRFVIPDKIKAAASVLSADYHSIDNQKIDSELVVGQAALKICEELSKSDQTLFYQTVRDYYTRACDYMRLNFPFNDDVVINAEVADLDKIGTSSFKNIKFFIERFPALVKTLGSDDKDELLDTLQSQFCALQIETLSDSIKSEQRIDLNLMKLCSYNESYNLLSKFMLAILTIPHSNAECERIFSYVTKTHTKFRPSLGNQSLENLLIVKSAMNEKCFEQSYTSDFLKKAKSATTICNTK